MMNPNLMTDITRDDLRDTYGLSEQEITDLDQEAQRIMGKTIMMVDTALRDESLTADERIAAGLNFIDMRMTLIQYNFDTLVEDKVPNRSMMN